MAKFKEIEQYLNTKSVNFKVIDLPSTAISVEDVIRLSNGQVRKEEIVKTLIVKAKDGQFVGCVLRGEDRLKRETLDRLATKEEVLQLAKVEFGAVCPILLGIPLLIDEKIMDLKMVNIGSGDLLKGLEMDLRSLLEVLSDYQIERISL